jgi:hypothetical protein
MEKKNGLTGRAVEGDALHLEHRCGRPRKREGELGNSLTTRDRHGDDTQGKAMAKADREDGA